MFGRIPEIINAGSALDGLLKHVFISVIPSCSNDSHMDTWTDTEATDFAAHLMLLIASIKKHISVPKVNMVHKWRLSEHHYDAIKSVNCQRDYFKSILSTSGMFFCCIVYVCLYACDRDIWQDGRT